MALPIKRRRQPNPYGVSSRWLMQPTAPPPPIPSIDLEEPSWDQGREKVGCTDTKFKMNVIENELSKIVGLDALKLQLRTWLKGMLMDQRRRAAGLPIGPRKLPQLVFLGNPGTGKTMIARMLSKLLHMVGILPTKKVVEVQRSDLVGTYIGQTGPKTREKIKEAEGGILFVDEAYRLVPMQTCRGDFGIEALEEIMSFMDFGRVVVILAGYKAQMDHLLSSNEGMRRRVSNIFYFDDFNCEQLARIMHIKLSSKDKNSPFYGFKLDARSTSVSDVAALINRETNAQQRGKMNGGLVDQMLVKARENLDSRIDVECTDKYDMVAITFQDLCVGLRSLRAQGGSIGINAHQMGEEMDKPGELKLDPMAMCDMIYNSLRRGFEKCISEFPPPTLPMLKKGEEMEKAGELKLDPMAMCDMIYNSLRRGFEKCINEFPPPRNTTLPMLKKSSEDPVITQFSMLKKSSEDPVIVVLE